MILLTGSFGNQDIGDDAMYNTAKRYHIERITKYKINPIAKKVYKKFGWKALYRSCGINLFYDVIMDLPKFDIAIEIGTFNGLTAAIMAQRFKHVITIDILNMPLRVRMWEYLGVKNIKFMEINGERQKKNLINALKFDFAFSDGNHHRDSQTDFDLLKKCGHVLLHDDKGQSDNLIDSLDMVQRFNNRYYRFVYWDAEKAKT